MGVCAKLCCHQTLRGVLAMALMEESELVCDPLNFRNTRDYCLLLLSYHKFLLWGFKSEDGTCPWTKSTP